MNTLTRLDAYVASILLPSSTPRTAVAPASQGASGAQGSISTPVDVSGPSSRISNLPPTPRKPRRRRHKPTTSSIKLPPPTTPLLLRILLALWSILLSLWTSLVVETRAERVKRRRKPRPSLIRQLSEAVSPTAEAVEDEIGLGSEGEAEAEAEGSASEIEGGLASSDDEWTDPVTRAPVDDKVDDPTDDEFSSSMPPPTPLPLLSLSPSPVTRQTDEKFSFRLRSAEGRALISAPDTPLPVPRTFVQQPTPPGILSNPLQQRLEQKRPPPSPSPRVAGDVTPRKSSARLLPNPIATNVLDPTVPAVPSSKTFSVATNSVPSPRKHTTPFHLQKTLILDLDETLIHSTSRPISYAASSGGGLLGLSGGLLGGRGKRREGHTVEVVLHGRSTTYHVYKRPHVDHFLKKVSSATTNFVLPFLVFRFVLRFRSS